MTNTVFFPGLGLEFTLDRVAFMLFGLPIYWYGILIASGMLLALLFAFRYARSFGIDADRMVDVILVSTVFSVLGGRAFYVAMAPFEYESFAQMGWNIKRLVKSPWIFIEVLELSGIKLQKQASHVFAMAKFILPTEYGLTSASPIQI